ncbi:MAG: UDP-glucose--hexose-1-phosphate uridylyltransferase [Coprobacillus sp.]
MNHLINQLIQFSLDHHFIQEEDIDYSVNLLLDLFHIDSFEKETIYDKTIDVTKILDPMLEYAIENKIIEDQLTQRDLFDTRIMNCVMPRPSEIIKIFEKQYQVNPIRATEYFYQLSIASNYIRKSRTDKNIVWKTLVEYGNIEISINLSKPEKDPKEIALARTMKSSGYPKCLLCKENVGFAGDYNRAARQTHRIIPVKLSQGNYYLQYSPYVYYNEHCIIFNEEHIPMVINRTTFENLFSFIDKFPHYMLGSNADLPIVGGSILTHDHYQGGCYEFPIQGARVIKTIKCEQYPRVTVEIVKWPLSTIRLTSSSKDDLIELSDHFLNQWIDYSDPSLDIISRTDGIRHNTITPIARMSQGKYQIDLVLRNNRTSEQYPDGIFHPHQENHHIKKENIGLIEVMGLAILPPRLKTELELLQDCLLDNKNILDYPELEKHIPWYQDILKTYQVNKDNVELILKEEVSKIFVNVLENAGVYKQNIEGIEGFVGFVETTLKHLKGA